MCGYLICLPLFRLLFSAVGPACEHAERPSVAVLPIGLFVELSGVARVCRALSACRRGRMQGICGVRERLSLGRHTPSRS